MGLISFVSAIKALFTGEKVQRDIQPLQERVERLESAVKTLNTRVNKLEEKVDSLVRMHTFKYRGNGASRTR